MIIATKKTNVSKVAVCYLPFAVMLLVAGKFNVAMFAISLVCFLGGALLFALAIAETDKVIRNELLFYSILMLAFFDLATTFFFLFGR